jgi:hypothetical protein
MRRSQAGGDKPCHTHSHEHSRDGCCPSMGCRPRLYGRFPRIEWWGGAGALILGEDAGEPVVVVYDGETADRFLKEEEGGFHHGGSTVSLPVHSSVPPIMTRISPRLKATPPTRRLTPHPSTGLVTATVKNRAPSAMKAPARIASTSRPPHHRMACCPPPRQRC